MDGERFEQGCQVSFGIEESLYHCESFPVRVSLCSSFELIGFRGGSQTHSTSVSVIHSDSVSPHPVVQDEQDQYLFRKALQSSEYWFELKSLVSQARGEVSFPSLAPFLPLSSWKEYRELNPSVLFPLLVVDSPGTCAVTFDEYGSPTGREVEDKSWERGIGVYVGRERGSFRSKGPRAVYLTIASMGGLSIEP